MRAAAFGREEGITLVELSIASFILLIISAIMLTALMMVARTNNIVAEDTEALTTARIARQRIERELRQADEILTASSATSLGLWLDANNDDVKDAGELVTWTFADIDGVPGGKAELMRTVADPAFDPQPNGIHYRSPLGSGYTPFTYDVTAPATQKVTITLIVEPETDGRGGEPVTLTSTVSPRNVS
jgi:type II secretory pathway pseudopilin PulG